MEFIIFALHILIVRFVATCIFACNRLLSRWVDRFGLLYSYYIPFVSLRWAVIWRLYSPQGNAYWIEKTYDIKSRSNFMSTRQCSTYKQLYLLHKRIKSHQIWLKTNNWQDSSSNNNNTTIACDDSDCFVIFCSI